MPIKSSSKTPCLGQALLFVDHHHDSVSHALIVLYCHPHSLFLTPILSIMSEIRRKFIILDDATIAQSHITNDNTSKPQRKRRRVDEESETDTYSIPSRRKIVTHKPPTKDKVYYTSASKRKPGECVLSAQNILFTVRSMRALIIAFILMDRPGR
jgi:hypothetical protein